MHRACHHLAFAGPMTPAPTLRSRSGQGSRAWLVVARGRRGITVHKLCSRSYCRRRVASPPTVPNLGALEPNLEVQQIETPPQSNALQRTTTSAHLCQGRTGLDLCPPFARLHSQPVAAGRVAWILAIRDRLASGDQQFPGQAHGDVCLAGIKTKTAFKCRRHSASCALD